MAGAPTVKCSAISGEVTRLIAIIAASSGGWLSLSTCSIQRERGAKVCPWRIGCRSILKRYPTSRLVELAAFIKFMLPLLFISGCDTVGNSV